MAPTTRSKRKHQKEELERELLECCSSQSRFGRARELVEIERVNVNCTDGRGWTPLILAAAHGQVHLAGFLLENGANVRAMDRDGWTALFFAVISRNVALARLLLENNANIEAQFRVDGRMYSLLGYAISWRSVAIVALLLLWDANTEETLFDNKTYSALYIACWRSKVEVVQLLLDHDDGVDVNAFEQRGDDARAAMSPLCQACINNNMEMAQLLVQHGARVTFDGVFPDVPSPMVHAVEHASPGLVSFLLDHSRFSEPVNENVLLPGHMEGEGTDPLSPALDTAIRLEKVEAAQLLVDRSVVLARTLSTVVPFCGSAVPLVADKS